MDRNSAMLLMIASIVVVVAFVMWAAMRRKRSVDLRRQFGPEYDHMKGETGSVSRTEAELERRAKRVHQFHIHPLPPDRRARFAERWQQEQAMFVDAPRNAIDNADHLVEEVMRERGYPVGEFDQKAADISVDHPHVVEDYRAAHEIAERGRRGQATTEDLRQAMIHYRTLFLELLEEPLPGTLQPRGVPAR